MSISVISIPNNQHSVCVCVPLTKIMSKGFFFIVEEETTYYGVSLYYVGMYNDLTYQRKRQIVALNLRITCLQGSPLKSAEAKFSF